MRECNPHAIALRRHGQNITTFIDNRNAGIPLLTQSLSVASSVFEIGGIMSDRNQGNILIHYKISDTQSSAVSGTSKLVEPLCYPLFFPHGETGWSSDLRKEFGFSDYLACRLLMTEKIYNNNSNLHDVIENLTLFEYDENNKVPMVKMNAAGTRELKTNRFQLLTRLSSYYIVEEMCRAIDYTLSWHSKKENQNLIFGKADTSNHDDAQVDIDGEVNNDPLGDEDRRSDQKSYLADSFFGSPRHLKKQSLNALTIVSEKGRQLLFITLTCNTHWPEIQERLFEGQTAFEREDIVCIVFKARLAAFLHNLRQGKYFNGGKVVWIVHVIEYQHRGLPHAHIACRLSNAPNHRIKEDCVLWIDSNVSAEMPIVTDRSTLQDLEYQKLVKDHMIHTCAPPTAVNGCRHKVTLLCTKGYSDRVIIEQSALDEKGYPIYRRRNEADLFVVPHNREVLLDWKGHANVEYAGSTYSVLYLFKYLHKGSGKVKVSLDNTADIGEEDEINLYLRGRMLCSMEATWRVLGYQTYPASYPAVQLIKVKLEEHVNIMYDNDKACDMGVYFARPMYDTTRLLKYTEFFKLWDYGYKLPARFNQNVVFGEEEDESNQDFYEIRIPKLSKPMWIFKRIKPDSSVVRMSYIYITAGEIWYLRLLLLNFPAISFQDTRTVDGVLHATYQEAAIARGLVRDQNEAETCFREAMQISTPRELRSLLVMLTVQGFPTLIIYNNEDLRFAMLEDFFAGNGNNLQMASVKLLDDIHERFRDEEKDAALYGFPPPVNAKSELELEKLKYNPTEQAALLCNLQEHIPNTDEQRRSFIELTKKLDALCQYKISGHQVNGELIFIQGQGGSGKSTFAKKLLAYARSKGLLARGCSSTGLSCQVYENLNFTTAHTLFGIPVSEDEDGDYDHDAKLFSSMSHERKELLSHTSLIIWDEFLSNHKQCLQCAYDATDKFANCLVVCMGDYRQIAPVVVHGNVADTVNASPLSSYLWNKFRIFKFTRNMRLFGRDNLDPRDVHEQNQYAQMLLELSEGDSYSGLRVQSLLDTDPETGSSLVRLPLIKAIHDVQESLAFVFPDGFSPNTMHKASILASTNEEGDNWNKIVQEMNPKESKTYLSADVFDQIDDPNGFVQEMLTTEALNSFTKNGCPAHKLELKVDDICIILRNINKRDGLTNNTRVRITHLTTFSVRIQTLGDIPRSHILPRIKFKFKIPFGTAFTMTRTQFPLRLAYCMTFNKAQGQEWDKVLADTRNAPFSHGHLYVVASRIRHNNNIRVYCDKEEHMVDGAPIVTNVVFKQLKIE